MILRMIQKGLILVLALSMGAIAVDLKVDTISGNVMIKYVVPEGAPKAVKVSCEYAVGGGDFLPAAVRKYRSQTAEAILWNNRSQRGVIRDEMQSGVVTEYMAAGLERTLVWQVTGQLMQGQRNRVTVQIQISDPAGGVLVTYKKEGVIDLSKIILLSDFSKVLQKNEVAIGNREGEGWYWIPPKGHKQYGTLRAGKGPFTLNPLTIRPKLSGYYAIYVGLPYSINGCAAIRLSDDMYDQVMYSGDPRECFWKMADLTGRNIVISQWNTDSNRDRTGVCYLRLVPVSKDVYKASQRFRTYPKNKFTACHTEPFSWAAYWDITNNSEYSAALAAFKDARLDWVDFQMGRLGMRPVFPTSLDVPIVGSSARETGPGTAVVKQSGSSLLSMSTDALTASMVFAKAFGVGFSANFGAGIAYSGALRSDWAVRNGQYLRDGVWPQYKHKPVRKEALRYFKDFLDKGSRCISLDFCRYPNVIEEDDTKTATLFLTELRRLADRYTSDGERVRILVRFPVAGVKGCGNNYNPSEWVTRRLVDIIVPSGDCGNVNYFDIKPYLEMTRGSGVKCLPCVNLISLALPFPGQVIQRVYELYADGCEGVYLYQAGAMVVGWMGCESSYARDIIAALGSSEAVKEMYNEINAKNQHYSRDVYFHYPQEYKNRRVRVWVEGFEPSEVLTYLNGKLMNTFDGSDKLYRIGKDGSQNDYNASASPVVFSVRLRQGDQWFKKEMKVNGIH